MNNKLLCFLAFLGMCYGGDIDLTDADFDDKLASIDTALVMFYAPWCGHCKKLKPEYTEAAKILLAGDPPVTLAKVDCTEEGKDTCGRFSVSGYPTLKIFKNGEVSGDYNGPRDAKGIVKTMESEVGPASKEMSDHVSVKEYGNKKDAAVVACYSEDPAVQKAFSAVASKLKDSCLFAHTNKKSGEFDGIVMHRRSKLESKFEATDLKYEGDVTDLHEWIKTNIHGLAGERTFDNAKKFSKPLVVVYYDVDYVKNVKGTNYWRNRVMKVAQDFAKDYSFAVSNREDFLQELESFGSTDPRKSPLATIVDHEDKKYVMTEEFSVESFKKFMTSAKEGKLEPFIKSEPVPDNSQNDVKVAVAKNFQELVESEKEKDILIEFYAPWCGHCKKLTPIYEEVAKELKGEDVMLVKMDYTANDAPSKFNVRGFPTLYWIPAGGSPTSYEGGREKEDFINFIAKKVTKELNKYDRSGKPKKSEL